MSAHQIASAITIEVGKVDYSDPAGTFGGWFLHMSTHTCGGTDWNNEVLARILKMFPGTAANYYFTTTAYVITAPADLDPDV